MTQPIMPRWFMLRDFANAACSVAVALLLFGLRSTAADEKATAPTAQQKAAHLEQMHKLAQSIGVFEISDDKRVGAEMVEQPVLAYRDNTRKLNDSTMWIWGREGRPSAIIAIEHYPQRPQEPKWLYEIASLSTGHIAAERGQDLNWKARQPGLNLKPLTGAATPAEKPTARLAQMRQLRRRFTAHEVATVGGRIELQQLSAPLYRYEDSKHGILDGAIFAFANGTNPEVLWIIEAHAKPGNQPTWHFGMAQMTGAQVFVEVDDKEVWKCDEADPPSERESYINGWMSAEKE